MRPTRPQPQPRPIRKFDRPDRYAFRWSNRLGWWAATKVDGILNQAERTQLVDQLLNRQQEDGGWSLPSLGNWVRSDGTAQATVSDGYATGLVLHILQSAGVPKDAAKVAKGLDWLRQNQSATGSWRGISVNKNRDPASHAGKFMSDAATAFAVLALGHGIK